MSNTGFLRKCLVEVPWLLCKDKGDVLQSSPVTLSGTGCCQRPVCCLWTSEELNVLEENPTRFVSSFWWWSWRNPQKPRPGATGELPVRSLVSSGAVARAGSPDLGAGVHLRALHGARLSGVVVGRLAPSQVGLATPASPTALPHFGGLHWLPQGSSGPVLSSVGAPDPEP